MKPAKRILVIDDEQHIQDVVEFVLKQHGFDVLCALDGEAGLEKFKTAAPDLVVLDLGLPGIDGLDLFRQMRALRPDAPVIMLTSRTDEIDRVLGLELGADDYITKPFSTRELAARVRNILRRAAPGPSEEPSPAGVAYGPLRLDPESYSAWWFGRQVPLTRAEYLLMEQLAEHPARVFTRDMLMDRLYDGEHVVTDRSIDAYVKRLRRKFADVRPEPSPIETVHSLGYKLNQRIGKCA